MASSRWLGDFASTKKQFFTCRPPIGGICARIRLSSCTEENRASDTSTLARMHFLLDASVFANGSHRLAHGVLSSRLATNKISAAEAVARLLKRNQARPVVV